MTGKTGVLLTTLGLGVFAAGLPQAQADPAKPAAPAPPMTAKQILDGAEARAVQIVINASRSRDALLRANAMEAILPRPNRALPMAQLAMEDENPAVRFAALVTAGKLRLQPLGPEAARLIGDPNASVRAAALFAASQCGQDVNMNEIPKLLGDKDATVRANMAMLLGLMGDRSAVPMLHEFVKKPMPRTSQARQTLLRLQFAEALVRLGEDDEYQPIQAAMFSQDYEVRVIAVQMLGTLDDQSMVPAIKNFLRDQPLELKLAAAQALGQLGLDAGRQVAIESASLDAEGIQAQIHELMRRKRNRPLLGQFRALLKDPQRQQAMAAQARAQSAFALAEIPGADTAAALVKLLDDPDPIVRLSGAAGVLKVKR